MTTDASWQQASMAELANHIVNTHHAYMYRELPLVESLLTAHLRAHWFKHPELLKTHQLFRQMQTELMQHMIKEETGGFSLLNARAQNPEISIQPFVDYIGQHLKDHASVHELLAQIRAALHDYVLPDDLKSDMESTCDRLRQIEADLAQHIHLEDDILFAKCRQA
ncbi:hemerythrin domain-containing protein [Castellaniella caeni]